MADIFVTEEYIDGVEDQTEIQAQTPQVQSLIKETEESPQLLNETDNSDAVKESESCSEMTLKQGEQDTDQFAVDGLLVNPDDLLPPVVKLEKYVDSDITFNRQVVVRNLLETLRAVQGNHENVARVINVLWTLSDDYDPIVRSELMGQFPNIAAFCKESGLNSTVQQYLWPIIINYLGAENNQVRKAAHSALLTIVEQKLIDTDTVTEKICPLIVHVTDSVHPEDLRTDSIQLMSKLAVLLGKRVTEELFLQHFFSLCADKSNYVRKACASSFGDICTTVGEETTEKLLLPKFIELCKDSAWCVRKACAENFMPVSCVVSRETRCRELSDIYMILLKDQSRWVRVTAYQGLGPFISTFAEPYKTGLHYSEGVLTIVDIQEFRKALSHLKIEKVESTETSSVDRTSTSEPCDSTPIPEVDIDSLYSEFESIVPLSCSEKSRTASEIPGIPCHVGKYSTVIEVSCPNTTATAAKDNVVEDTTKYHSADSGSPSLTESCGESVVGNCVNKNMVNHFKYSEETIPLVNGDCSKIDEDVIILNSSDIEKNQTLAPVQNSITVNGIHLDSQVRSESLNCVNCVISKGKQINSINEDKIDNTENSTSIVKDCEFVFEVKECDWLNCDQKMPEKLKVSEKKPFSVNHNHGAITDSGSESSAVTSEQNSIQSASPIDESAFNHFQYWRTPIPEIDIDFLYSEFESSYTSNNKSGTSMQNENNLSLFNGGRKEPYIFENSNLSVEMKNGEYDRTSENKEGEPPPGQNNITVHDQDIVPPELLLCYLNMIDAAWNEIAHHCAYSLPAVAITLGRKFWPCLKETFDALSSDLQGFIMMWKVRRTVASSMHQLAVILGPDITSKDLLPVFSRFIKDLDEVRIGILQHMSEFLKELRPEERKQFLPSLSEFLVSKSDTESKEKNWRFRLILAEQLVSVADLYEPEDVKEHLVPLSLTLIQDKICEVRLAAVRVMAAVMKRMSQHPTPVLTKAVLSELTEKFIHSPKWFHRQLYVYICQEFIVQNSLPPDQFAEDALPQLLYLCWDRVPNVRIAIARCLAVVIWPLETFSSPDSPHRELLLQTIHTLQSDLDVDVQFYANMVSTHECSCLQHGEFTNLGELPV